MICCNTNTAGIFTRSPFISITSSIPNYVEPNYNPNRSSSYTPIQRCWIESENPFPTQERFTIVSYNILGDRNAFKHRDLYPNVPYYRLKWDRRKRVIRDELGGYNADIICLQEVDKYFDLLSIMEESGYAGNYKRRSGDNVDGCAMFWKQDKFQLLEGESIEFKNLGLRDNVAQLSVFEMCKVESRRLLVVVGNIHVLYNPSRGDVKLGQIRYLSSRAHRLSERWGNIPVVLTGDFNSTPQSAIYKFLSSSKLNIMSYNRKELSGQRNCRPAQVFGIEREIESPFQLVDRIMDFCWNIEEVRTATGTADNQVVEHPLKLTSSYSTLRGSKETRGTNGEPLATSYHSKFLGTVDFIWYSQGLEPTRLLDTLPIDVLRKTKGLPYKNLGSDHLALVTEFVFTEDEEDNGDNKAATLSSPVSFPLASASKDDNSLP